MLEFSRSALVDADVLLYVTEPQDTIDRNPEFIEKVKRMAAAGTKVFLIINKIDLTTQATLEDLVTFWHKTLPQAEIFQISAQERFGIDSLMQRIVEVLPECPPFFDKDQLTDKPERFFVNEIIREKILLNYDKEIPYSVEVEVEQFKEEASIIRISAVIYVERESQKGIIIGRAGAALKKVGSDARRDLETFFGKKIFLELFVKVDKDWRQKSSRLKHYGYDLN
jgi:GTP-binding protein Era